MNSRTLVASLDVLTVAELFAALAGARRTGRLEVLGPAGRRALFLEAGTFTGSTSTHDDDKLGQILWRTGRVSLDQVLIGTEMAKEGKKLGRVLVELGFLDPLELRKGLIAQAVLVFEAACLETQGDAVFTMDAKHPSPIRFGVSTGELIGEALKRVDEHRELLKKLGALDKPLRTNGAPPPHAPLQDAEQAMLQLAVSSQARLTGGKLIDKSGLGALDGARTLLSLLEKGLLTDKEQKSADDHVLLRVKRLCAAINLVMAALDDAGFGVGDSVREYVQNPPASYEEALSGVSLDGPLEEDAVLQHAKFVSTGLHGLEAALAAVLYDALMQARDTLAADLTAKLEERVGALTSAG